MVKGIFLTEEEVKDFVENEVFDKILKNLDIQLCTSKEQVDEEIDDEIDQEFDDEINQESEDEDKVEVYFTTKYDKNLINSLIKESNKKTFASIKATASVLNELVQMTEVKINKNAYNLIRFLISLESRKDI